VLAAAFDLAPAAALIAAFHRDALIALDHTKPRKSRGWPIVQH
jgi:hypothetical protein